MRILVLTTDAFGGHGGIAKYNQDFLTALCTHPDCEEVIAIPRLIQDHVGTIPSRLTYIENGSNGKLKYIIATLATIIKRRKFDLIICAHINLLPFAFIVKLLLKQPLVLLVYGVEVWQPSRKVFTNYLIKYIDSIISISKLTKQRFLNWADLDKTKKFILSNGVDLERITPGYKSTLLLERYGLKGKTILLTLGRLAANERAKGVDNVLELLPELIKEKIPNIVYLVVGDGTDRLRLEEKTAHLNIKKYVIFTGYVPENEKIEHYRLADVYVMPSRLEGFGFVLLEAMACGIPVVASKIDGSREALRNGDLGILVDPNSPKEIKDGILEALKRPRGIVPPGLEYFSYENFERKCHQIINQLMESQENLQKTRGRSGWINI